MKFENIKKGDKVWGISATYYDPMILKVLRLTPCYIITEGGHKFRKKDGEHSNSAVPSGWYGAPGEEKKIHLNRTTFSNIELYGTK